MFHYRFNSPPNMAARPTLYLHVGLRKTGSSYIQTALAMNRSKLYREGHLWYPRPTDQESALRGKTSSGNAPSRKLWKTLERIRPQLRKGRNVLVSREQFFDTTAEILGVEATKAVLEREVIRTIQVADIKMLLFVRDPLDWCFSMYSQEVKHSRITVSFQDWLQTGIGFPPRTLELIEWFSALGVEIEVENYTTVKSHILDRFMEWLDLPATLRLSTPGFGPVNRSLNLGELKFQRIANEFRDWDSEDVIANAFAEKANTVAPSEPPICSDEYEKFVVRCAATVEALNQLLPEGSRLTLQEYRQTWAEAFDQESRTDVVLAPNSARALVEKIRELHQSAPSR